MRCLFGKFVVLVVVVSEFGVQSTLRSLHIFWEGPPWQCCLDCHSLIQKLPLLALEKMMGHETLFGGWSFSVSTVTQPFGWVTSKHACASSVGADSQHAPPK